jgi:hypothetical protein
MSSTADALPPCTPAELAAHWRARRRPAEELPVEQIPSTPLPAAEPTWHVLAALADFVAASILSGETLLLVVPDDEWLPDLSNALDLDLRPFCLVLPEADFAAAVTLRATLALLRSRLARPVEVAHAACWDALRRHLEDEASLWQAALDWSAAGGMGATWPARIGELFPVLIVPAAQAATLQLHGQVMRDTLLMLHAERMMEAVPHLRASAHHLLLLRDPAISVSRELAPVDEARRLKAEIEVLAQELAELELEFATAQAELAEFTQRYHLLIGRDLAELDRLQAEIARRLAQRAPSDPAIRQQAEQARAQAQQSRRENERFERAAEQDRAQHGEQSFAPSQDLKRLFRQLAQKIHPDRAEDEPDRAWRTELMSEANRAYRAGDEMVLRDIFAQWQEGRPAADDTPEHRASTSAPSSNPARNSMRAASAALQRQLDRLQQRIAEVSEQLNRLLASRLYELFAAANLAKSRGRDLLQEMAVQLDLQLEAARAQLAMLCRDE